MLTSLIFSIWRVFKHLMSWRLIILVLLLYHNNIKIVRNNINSELNNLGMPLSEDIDIKIVEKKTGLSQIIDDGRNLLLSLCNLVQDTHEEVSGISPSSSNKLFQSFVGKNVINPNYYSFSFYNLLIIFWICGNFR